MRAVCVFVTYEALWGLDPSQVRDVPAAHVIFEANRVRIEGLASKRFDERSSQDSRQGNQPSPYGPTTSIPHDPLQRASDDAETFCRANVVMDRK